MLDCGTKPVDYAIAKLYKYMEANKKCGGCCGEIEVEFEEDYKDCFWEPILTSAQYFEYKIGHMPDKATEALSGFISVLPGAYTLFRWKTIQGKPLLKFFENLEATGQADMAKKNEYLAEDRVMCL